MGYLTVNLMNLVTIGNTNLDHFCCSEDDIHAGIIPWTESSSPLILFPFSNMLLYFYIGISSQNEHKALLLPGLIPCLQRRSMMNEV